MTAAFFLARSVRAGSVPDAPQKAGLESQILPLMQRQPDLLDAALATVVPEQPLLAIEDRIWFVNSVVVPLVLARPNDGVGSMALPVGDAVLRAGHADLRIVHVPKADVEHDVPVALPNDLAGGNSVLLPGILGVGLEDRIVLVSGPFQAAFAGGVADGVRFVLLAARVPHAIELCLVVVDDVRTHHRHFFPRLFRR